MTDKNPQWDMEAIGIYNEYAGKPPEQLREEILKLGTAMELARSHKFDTTHVCIICGTNCLGLFPGNNYPTIDRPNKQGVLYRSVGTLCRLHMGYKVRQDLLKILIPQREAYKKHPEKIQAETPREVINHIYNELEKIYTGA